MNNKILVLVEGNINKFIKKHNINILNIKYVSHNKIIITIYYKDYYKLYKLRGFKYKVLNKYGYIKIKELFKKYKCFVYSFIFGIILLIILSNVIFDIEVVSDNKELKNIIYKELDNYDIKRYSFKKNYKENTNIKNNIKEKYKDNIEWIEIKNDGVKVIVNVLERKKTKKENDDNIYNIVAKKNGFIKRVDVINGIKVIDENNYVNKGDIVISSDIYLNDELKNRVSAKGNVYAEVWYKVVCEYPIYTKIKKFDNKKRKILFIKINNKYYELLKYKNYDRKELYTFHDELTNITLGIEEINKYTIENKKYSTLEVNNLALENAREKINSKLSDKEYIIDEKTLNFNIKGSKIIVEMFFSVYEDISKLEKVSE